MSVEKFRKQRAVNVVVTGNYTLPNWYDPQGKLRTFACRTTRVSPFRMMVDVPVVGKVGDRLTTYFRDFGNFEASISETQTGSFLLELDMDSPDAGKVRQQAHLAGKEAERAEPPRLAQGCAHHPGKSAFNPDPGRRHHPGMLRDRHVAVRCRGLGATAATDWNAVGRGSLYRSRHQAVAGWLRGQIRRAA